MAFKTIIIVFQLFILTLFVGCSEKNEVSVHKISELSNKTGTEVPLVIFIYIQTSHMIQQQMLLEPHPMTLIDMLKERVYRCFH